MYVCVRACVRACVRVFAGVPLCVCVCVCVCVCRWGQYALRDLPPNELRGFDAARAYLAFPEHQGATDGLQLGLRLVLQMVYGWVYGWFTADSDGKVARGAGRGVSRLRRVPRRRRRLTAGLHWIYSWFTADFGEKKRWRT